MQKAVQAEPNAAERTHLVLDLGGKKRKHHAPVGEEEESDAHPCEIARKRNARTWRQRA